MSSLAPKDKTKDSKEKPKEKDKRPTLAGQRIRSRKRGEKNILLDLMASQTRK